MPNREVEIDVTDKSPFFITPYHIKEEDQKILDKEMKRLCYLEILKEGFSAYSSPIMLISRKVTKDIRVVTDFKHLNVRIAKKNLAYPLLKDTFLVKGSSWCKVLSVLDLKDAFHCLRLSDNSKNIMAFNHILLELVFISKNVYGIKHLAVNLALIYQCNFRLFTKQKILWGNNGWSITVYTIKEIMYS